MATYLVAHKSEHRRAELARVFSERGVKVRLARDGHRALAMAVASPPDLVIAQLSLPGLDGVKLARAMSARADLLLVPIILLASANNAQGRIEALRVGVDDVVVETALVEELELRAERAIKRPKQRPLTLSAGLRGSLGQFGVPSILGLLELDKKTGVLKVQHDDGRVAALSLREGRVVAAELLHTPVVGAEVIYELARWIDGSFAFKDEQNAPVVVKDTINLPTSLLILEAARRIDEGI